MHNLDVKIIQVEPKHLSLLRTLRLQLVAENPYIYGTTFEEEDKKTDNYFSEWIEEHSQKDSAMFIALVSNKAVGMCAARRDNPKSSGVGYFGSIGVLKEFQGQRIGKALMDARMEWVKAHTHFSKIITIIQKQNTNMLAIAKKDGFIITGEGEYRGIPEYYLEKEVL